MAIEPFHLSRRLHDLSLLNREAVEASVECGCFYCLKVYRAVEVDEWTDHGGTALCPMCGVDAVLPDEALDRPITLELLESLQKTYFISRASLEPGGRFHHLVTGNEGVATSPRFYATPLPLPIQSNQAVPWSPTSPFLGPLMSRWGLAGLVFANMPLLPMVVLAIGLGASGVIDAFFPAAPVWVASFSKGVFWAVGVMGTSLSVWWVRGKYWNALRALWALGSRDWSCPSLSQATGLGHPLDLRSPKTSDVLFRDARDWARATKSPVLKELWRDWMANPGHLRNENLRRFTQAARSEAGPSGPYEPGDPL